MIEPTTVDPKPICEECEAELPANALPGLCPDCLARMVLTGALARLRAECLAKGKMAQFEATRDFLSGGKLASTFAELAVTFETTETALKKLVSGLKWRLGELWREEMTNTLKRLEDANE